MKVLVLGGTGMLGSMVARVLSDEHEVLATARARPPLPYELDGMRWRRFAVDETAWLEVLRDLLGEGVGWVVNCLGATKPLMGEDAAGTANARFPGTLAEEAARVGAKVVHASTDCVFDGSGGWPSESTAPTAKDAYGRTKADGDEGAVRAGAVVLRCSLVGPECREPARHLLGQVVEGRVSTGWQDHLWNGLTTLHWARIVFGMIGVGGFYPPDLVHVVPSDSCSKERLVSTILQAFNWHLDGRCLEPGCSGKSADMRLSTERLTDVHAFLWHDAGYDRDPGVEQMVHELAEFCAREHWPPPGCPGSWRYWKHGRQ